MVELPHGPVPNMLSFKIDDLTESGVDALHDQNVTAGFRQYVHACADDIVI